MEARKGRPVVVTTEHRGVFFGYIVDESKAPNAITLSQCRNCVDWPQAVKGFLGLTTSGPLQGSRVGPAAVRVTLYGITSIADCTIEAVELWEKASWQHGDGSGDGSGYGYGSGDGSGSGYGHGYGYGSSNGVGCGDSYGSGSMREPQHPST
jgi:hypothetical protein